MANYYELLGVDRNATSEEIKIAYRKMAMKHHPDRNNGDARCEEHLKAINEAYDTLKDEKKRKAYDHRLKTNSYSPNTEYDFKNDEYNRFYDDVRSWWKHNNEDEYEYYDYKIYDDIINDINRKYYDSKVKTEINREVNINYSITLEDAHYGKQNVTLEIKTSRLDKKIIRFNIPAGIEDGTKIRLVRQGEDHNKGLPPSDVVVTINTIRHPTFTRINHDLSIFVEIDYYDAIIGKKVSIEGIDKKKLEVKIPKYIESGKILRLVGEGMNKHGGGRGDLYINVKVVPPKADAYMEDIIRNFKNCG